MLVSPWVFAGGVLLVGTVVGLFTAGIMWLALTDRGKGDGEEEGEEPWQR